MKRNTIAIRDPFVFYIQEERMYYLYGTTDPDPWKQPGIGFDAYMSQDLEDWIGPFPVFRPPAGFWATHNFWAPEVHRYKSCLYMFASFKAPGHARATQILRADRPLGPFFIHSQEPVTPPEWECLDGTLFVEDGKPWLIFCHEWVQVNDGEICAIPLSPDLSRAEGAPLLLFKGSEAPWTKALPRRDGSGLLDARVTDGPFLYHLGENLYLLWSSISSSGYALGIAKSKTGRLEDLWIQKPEPLLEEGRGHGMIFAAFDGKAYIAYHYPNDTPNERFHFREIRHENGWLALGKKEY